MRIVGVDNLSAFFLSQSNGFSVPFSPLPSSQVVSHQHSSAGPSRSFGANRNLELARMDTLIKSSDKGQPTTIDPATHPPAADT
jgi:hypothetical protein